MKRITKKEKAEFYRWASRYLRRLWNELHSKEKINEPND